MRHAETVTFGGSRLDRAVELRAAPDAVAEHVAQGRAEVIVLWRGKLLVAAPGLERLVRLPPDHPAIVAARMPPVLLGRDDEGQLVLAQDISQWVPEGPDPVAIGGLVDVGEQRHPELGEDMAFAELRRIMIRIGTRDAELAATAKALIGWHMAHAFCPRCGAKTEMTMAGWQRHCAACGAQHFPRTDPVVIMLITRGNRTLLGRSPGWPEGMYSCLAGFVEPGETLEAAVRREVFEEAGIKVGQVRYLASQPWAFPGSLMLGCHGEALDEAIHPDPAEIEDALWMGREELMEAFAGRHRRVQPAREGSIAHFLLRNWLADTLD